MIRRLYERDAMGIVDDELIDEVAFAFYARCQSIVSASTHRVPCPICDRDFALEAPGLPLLRDVLRCPRCGWATTGSDYRRSIKGKVLITQNRDAGGPFAQYPRRLEAARTPREEMLAVDWLIQQIHSLKMPRGRPVAVNLIEGTEAKVMAFLDELFTGSPAARDGYASWRSRLYLNSERGGGGSPRA
jgi:hypothetical protein